MESTNNGVNIDATVTVKNPNKPYSDGKRSSKKRKPKNEVDQKYDKVKRKRCREIIYMDYGKLLKLFVSSIVEVSSFIFGPWMESLLAKMSHGNNTDIEEAVSSMIKSSYKLRSSLSMKGFRLLDSTKSFQIVLRPFSDPILHVEWDKLDYQGQQCIQAFLFREYFTHIKSPITGKEIEYKHFKYDDYLNTYMENGLCLLLLVGEVLNLEHKKYNSTIITTLEELSSQHTKKLSERNLIPKTPSYNTIHEAATRSQLHSIRLPNSLVIDDDADIITLPTPIDRSARIPTENEHIETYTQETNDIFLSIIYKLKEMLHIESNSNNDSLQQEINKLIEELISQNNNKAQGSS
jgi:hypothetical protein